MNFEGIARKLSVPVILAAFLVASPSSANQLDIDGDGSVFPLTDGILILRHLFDFTGPALVNGAVGTGATRSTEQISAYLEQIGELLDVDGDGGASPLTDGLLIIRYLFDFNGGALVSGTIGAGATRDTAPEVTAYLSFLSTPGIQVVADPENFLVADPTEVRVQAQVFPHPDLDPATVSLFEVDDDLQPVGGALCSMEDNGSLDDGDDIAGDSVFSCIVTFTEASPGPIHVLVRAEVGPTTVSSLSFVLNAVEPLTEEQAQTILDAQEAANDIWLQKLAESGDTLQARLDAVEEILLLDGVADAGVSSDNVTIWIEYDSGVLGGLMLNPAGTRGSDAPAPIGDRASRSPVIAPADARDPPLFTRPGGAVLADLRRTPRGAVPENTPIGNTNVLIWDAFNSEFAPDDEGPALQQLYQNSVCPKYTVTYLLDTQCTVESVRSFTNFGTIILVTHGQVEGDNQVAFLTRETANLASMLAHSVDLVLKNISVSGDVFAIRPSFVDGLAGHFQNAIVYNGSCTSAANLTMANAFFGEGAETYYGYTKVVNSDFAQSSAMQLFNELVNNFTGTGAAFSMVSPKVDPTAPNATFAQSGNLELAYTGDLQNGDFETGDLTAWQRFGDGRVLASLGAISPPEGSYMGIVSTGLGFTTDSGSIEQNFCLPESATSLKFDWNYNSEEFIEYCGAQHPFDDPFRVVLETDTATHVLFERTVDSLCASVSPTGLFFDVSGPGCIPSDGVGFGTGGNDCKVHGTGWLSQMIDISALALANDGKGVRLEFSTSDAGDSVYDSATLVDKIQVVVP